jgi:hypothetical protein
MNINVHIERVVLDGVRVGETRGMRRTMERELTRLLAEGGLSPEFHGGGALPSVRGGTIGLEKGCPAARLGAQVAGAVYHGIGVRK